MKKIISLYLLLSLLTMAIGCRAPMKKVAPKPAYDKPLLPGQNALIKIRDEMQFEYKQLIGSVEDKMNKNMKIISEDVNDFGEKWDKELQRFQVQINKKVDDNDQQT